MQEKEYELSPETSHPKAKELLVEEFFWNIADESGPFGNDDGNDAFYFFREWRFDNPNVSPVVFLTDLMEEWGITPFEWSASHKVASEFERRLLWTQDSATIAVGIGQLVLEGRIDQDVIALTKAALQRELLPDFLVKWREDYREIRIQQLTKMLSILDRVNK